VHRCGRIKMNQNEAFRSKTQHSEIASDCLEMLRAIS
jgi:hypothetical protein